MDILSYTESPFARVPRLHHKDALEGPSSAGFGRRNLVGMMGVMMDGGGESPDPYHGYISDGLVAYWDGIDNVGNGSHDASARSWIDLVSGRMWNLSDALSFSDDGVDFEGDSSKFCAMSVDDSEVCFGSSVVTMELAIHVNSTTSVIGTLLKTQSGSRFGAAIHSASTLITSNNSSSTFNLPYIQTDDYSLSMLYGSTSATSVIKNGSESLATKSWDNIGQSQSYATLGRRINGGNNFWRGGVYAMRLYSRELTPSEVAANAANDRLRFGF